MKLLHAASTVARLLRGIPDIGGIVRDNTALVRRDYLNNPRARSIMAEAGWDMGEVISMSAKSTRGYGMPELHGGMMAAAALNTSVGGYAGTVRRCMEEDNANPDGTMPCGQWFSNKLTGVETEAAVGTFSKTAAMRLKELETAGFMPEGGWTVAVDAHKICRYDRIRGEDLFKSKYEKGTARFERYITVQCTDDGAHLNLGARPLYKGDSISGGLLQLMAECRAHGIRIKLVMLDREFFTVKCIRVLDELGLGYLTPCSNRPGVVTAIRQFADGKRQDVSENRLSGSDGTVSYTLVITERRRRKKNPKKDPPPEEKYIGFATNVPDIDVEVYVHRWVVETGYSKAEAMRPRTRSRNNGARLFCFLYALAIFNAWVMWNALLLTALAVHRRRKPMTQDEMKIVILESALVLKPPSPPPPDVQTAA